MVRRNGDWLGRLGALTILLLFCSSFVFGQVDVNSLPNPTGYVEDLAHVLNPQDKEELEAFCQEVDQQLSAQFALVTVDTLGDRPIRDFALDLGRKWGVGSKNTNQGLLIVLAIKDRQNDIEVGRGLEPFVTDGFAGSTRRAMQPDLRAGQYGAALITASRLLADHIAEGKGIPFSAGGSARPVQRAHERGGVPSLVMIVILFLVFWLIGRGGRRGGRGGRGGGIGNLATGVLIGDLLGGGRRGGGFGGDWGGGGGFGGGSGGGGGFGGFGGGDFGGGGASGNW